jgi:cytochrome b
MTGDPREPTVAVVRVWDLPVRLVHWGLVALVALAYATGSEERYYAVHKATGIAILALVVFRVLWGFAGSRPARFASFLAGPRAVLGHVRDLAARRHSPAPTHNPLGGWGVLALLFLISAEIATGLTSSTFDYEGPLSSLLPDRASSAMADLHSILFDVLAAMILAHLVGVALTSWAGRENLVKSMLTGRKRLPRASVPAERADSWRAAIGCAIAACLICWALLSLPHFLK